MYLTDIEVLDQCVRDLKSAGAVKMSRSKLLRIAVHQLDMARVIRGLTTKEPLR
jgi:hypothetical protein